MIRVITIEREYGAGGAAIAEKLAARLGWKLWDQSLTEEIASQAHVDRSSIQRLEERVDPLFYRLMKVFMRGSFERSLPVGNLDYLDCANLVPFMSRVIENAAADGNCVIVGAARLICCAAVRMRFTFLFMPRGRRRCAGCASLARATPKRAELLQSIDHERATFVKTYFGKEWPTREFYHLMINSKVGDEIVAAKASYG